MSAKTLSTPALSLDDLAPPPAGNQILPVAIALSLVAHAAQIREVLGWSPGLDNLEVIVRSQLEWEFRLLREPELQRN